MITYELAKQLRDAGFPSGKDYEQQWEEFRDWIPPSLSELIEACGDGFKGLIPFESGDYKWVALEKIGSITTNSQEGLTLNGCRLWTGKTPEIAVVKLWLKLNDKEEKKTKS